MRTSLWALALAGLSPLLMAADGDSIEKAEWRKEKHHEIYLSGGAHLGPTSAAQAGLFYRHVFDAAFSLRGGIESGNFVVFTGSQQVAASFTKFSAHLLSNDALYGGIGATHVQAGLPITGLSNIVNVTIFESIIGARLNTGGTALGIEYRWGINGASTVNCYGGYRF